MNEQTIDHNRFYRPLEIAKNGFITNSRGAQGDMSSHYIYILKEIKAGKLKAVNYARGEKNRSFYKILGSEIVRYKKEVEGVEI
jgi:hypothetical protein